MTTPPFDATEPEQVDEGLRRAPRALPLGARPSGSGKVPWSTRVIPWSALIATVAILSAWLFGFGKIIQRNYFWQGGTESTLTSLHAGYSVNYFKQELGTPVITHPTSGGFTEDVFRGRGFWVETLTKDSNEVQFYSATTCETDVQPTFQMPGVGVVTLNKSSFASVSANPQYNYWFGGFGGSDSPAMREFAYSGFEGGYRWFMWGLSSACTDSAEQMYTIQRKYPSIGSAHPSASQMGVVRGQAIANTYGEAAPGVKLSSLPKDPEELGIGPVVTDLSAPYGPLIKRGGTPSPCLISGGPGLASWPLCGNIGS